MTPPLYATSAQARADALALDLEPLRGLVPWLLLSHVEAVVLDRRSDSDTLLITADALRDTAAPMTDTALGRALVALANTLSEIAPTRANPIEAANG